MRTADVHKLTVGSLLLALSILIPVYLGGSLSVVLGPFTATLASHVPTFLAMFLGPVTAGIVGVGSALGFFSRLGLLVGLRAAMHIPLGIAGALMLRDKKLSLPLTLLLLAPLHALLETVVALLYGWDFRQSLLLVGVGTLIHHAMDSIIAGLAWQAVLNRIPVIREFFAQS